MTNIRPYRDIPTLPGWPVVGNGLELRFRRLGALERVWHECGPIGRVRIGWRDLIVVTDPSVAHDILVTDADAYVKSRTLGEFARPLLGDGLLTSEGDLHRRQRRRLAGVFPHSKVTDWVSAMANRAERMQASWGDGSEIDIARSMMALTLEIVTETLFGSDVSEESAAMGNAVTDANRYISARVFSVFRPPEWLPTLARHRNRAAIASLDQTVYRIIDSRRRSGDARSDLLSILLSLDGGADGALTDREVRDEVMTLLFAGHETTANALGWTWLLLARNPGIATSMRDQIDQVLGGRTPTAEDLPNLPIVLQVFKETLRLYPPVYGVGRIATRPVAVGGYELPAGTTVGINTWGLHHREDLFPESSRFDPSRFERDRERALPPSSYLPFGDGPRVCIGNQFALVEGHVLLATLAQRVELEVAREEVVPEPLVTLRQHNGMPVRVRVRPSVTS